MGKKFSAIVFSIILTLSSVSLSESFDNNPNREGGDWIPYTQENIDSGKIKGGHDTITIEGMKLKKEVHKDDPKFREWADDPSVLPSLRTGAHDEDSTIPLLDDPPIGPNGRGNYLKHFYDPATGCGKRKGDGSIFLTKGVEFDISYTCQGQQG